MAPHNEKNSHQHAQLPAVAVEEIQAVRRRSSVLSAGKGEETPSILHEFGHEELDYPIFRRMSTVSLGDRPCVAFAPAAVGDTDKPLTEFRAYDEDVMDGLVMATYQTINTRQTVEYVREQHQKWGVLGRKKATVMQVLKELTEMIDESDPDNSAPQIFHAFQTAERCRELFPEHEWMSLVGLIHDAGKVLALFGQPQFGTVGDTFPVGCAMAEAHTFSRFYPLNPDSSDARYNTKHGMYQPRCGLDNVMMSYGHDEYLYQVLVRNGCPIPAEGLHIIRYHSFYAHHQKHAYDHLCSDKDLELREWLKKFQIADLYSKSENLPNVQELMPHYLALIDKYCPGVLDW